MSFETKIMCANKTHQGIITYFLEQIQNYIDEITEDDLDFDIFLNVLQELIRKSNEDVIFAFLGAEHEERWLKSLPMTVYYAVIGYMHLISVDLIDTTEKLNNLVNKTLDELELINDSGKDYYKIYLN